MATEANGENAGVRRGGPPAFPSAVSRRDAPGRE